MIDVRNNRKRIQGLVLLLWVAQPMLEIDALDILHHHHIFSQPYNHCHTENKEPMYPPAEPCYSLISGSTYSPAPSSSFYQA
jgi:hypothetical protein